jgi:hypothetical protein
MPHTSLRFGIAGVLALVLIRTLVPAGFMPALVDGRLSLVICDSSAWSGSAGAALHHHHGPASGGLQHADGDCCYAQSASPALLISIDLAAAGTQRLSFIQNHFDSGVRVSEPFRHHFARGPPA